ncbi:MAG TPA: hypothetical protein VJP86_12075 [Vicinamibacterales bacterium]|nr:hypothetical protein [Vicinamibacterales bacterium]
MAKRRSKGATGAVRKVSAAALRRAMATVNTRMAADATRQISLYRELSKHRSRVRTALDRAGRDRLAVRAAVNGDRARKIGKLLARHTVAPVVPFTPGIFDAATVLRLTPGYDLGSIQSFPKNARNSAFVHRRTGEMGFDVFAERHGEDASATIALSAVFIPSTGPAHLKATISPSISFAFWTISTGTVAITLALKSFSISPFRFDGSFDVNVPTTGGGFNTIWFKQIGIDLDFGFGTEETPMHASADVDTNHFYVIGLECIGQAFSAGDDRPGFTSNAGGILRASLPFIDLELRSIPIVFG